MSVIAPPIALVFRCSCTRLECSGTLAMEFAEIAPAG
jgi:hypothetical protein